MHDTAKLDVLMLLSGMQESHEDRRLLRHEAVRLFARKMAMSQAIASKYQLSDAVINENCGLLKNCRIKLLKWKRPTTKTSISNALVKSKPLFGYGESSTNTRDGDY